MIAQDELTRLCRGQETAGATQRNGCSKVAWLGPASLRPARTTTSSRSWNNNPARAALESGLRNAQCPRGRANRFKKRSREHHHTPQMLPAKIRDLVVELRDRTEKGLITWNYDDENSTVTTDQRKFIFSITYRFDEAEEVGRFSIKHVDKRSRKEHFFSTAQFYGDYDLVRTLFDSGQSSDLDLDLGLESNLVSCD